MPNIYIDSSFFPPHESGNNVDVNYTVRVNGFIGAYNQRVDFSTYTSDYLKTEGVNSDVVISLLELSEGFADSVVSFVKHEKVSHLMDLEVIFNTFDISTTHSGSLNSYVNYIGGSIISPSGTGINHLVDIAIGQHFIMSYNYLTEFWNYEERFGTINNDVSYMNYTGTLNPSGIPIEFYYGDINRQLEYGLSDIGAVSLLDNRVELFFAGWIRHILGVDCITGLVNTNSIYADVELGKGKKDGYYLDVLSTNLRERHAVDFDLFSVLVDYYELPYEVQTISGTKQCLYNDVFSTNLSTFGCNLDIDLFTIYFDNFSIGKGEYIGINDNICVDAHDYVYGLVASGTYFKSGDTVISGSLIEIDTGFRICFSISDNLDLFSGITTITAVATNNNNEVLEENYYLTSGYIVDFNNNPTNGLDFGNNNRVYVRMEAEGMASCPTVVSDGYYFVSGDLYNYDLKAYIFPVGSYWSDEKDLSASIYPHSTAYFYDKEFEVVIRAKDYAGNETEPYVINFKIHNPVE